MKIIIAFYTYVLTAITDSYGAYKTYEDSISDSTLDKQAKELAFNRLFLSLTKIFGLRILVPLVVFVGMVYLIKLYLVYICTALFIIYWIYDKYHIEPNDDDLERRYTFVRDFIFKPLYELAEYLPIKALQSVSDIVNNPEIINLGQCSLLAYKLMKTTPDQTEPEKIEFAKKILQSNIEQKLDLHEALFQDRSTYAKDLRTLTVTDIIDYGTHYQILIAYIDNPFIYRYVRNKISTTPKPPSDDEIKDGDF